MEKETYLVMHFDKFNASVSDGMGDYYDPETGLMISSPYDSAAGPSSIMTGPSFTPGGIQPIASNVPAPSSGFNWASILAPFTNAASKIAVAQFGQPQLAPGTFIQTTPGGGSIITNQPIGGGISNLGFSSLSSLSGSSFLMPLLLIGGAFLLLGRR